MGNAVFPKNGKIAKWMCDEDAGENKIQTPGRAVSQFPELFGGTTGENLKKDARCFKEREQILTEHKKNNSRNNDICSTYVKYHGVRISLSKALHGRGRKRQAWVVAAHELLIEDFYRYRKTGIKMNTNFLKHMVQAIVEKTIFPHRINERTGRSIMSYFDARWLQAFMDRNNIVVWKQSGKLLVSPKNRKSLIARFCFIPDN